MRPAMPSRLRDTLHRALTTPKGDALAPIRVTKDLARRLNVTLGQPIASAEELAKRAAARERLEELRRSGKAEEKRTLTAPVVVYFEKNRNERELRRIEDLLGAKKISFRALDVAGDEAAIAFVTNAAKVELDQLPVVFVGPKAIGAYPALVAADVSGELAKALRGE
jgi:hypothetical protein